MERLGVFTRLLGPLFISCQAEFCLGQSRTGTLLGNVADQKGAAVPAANVQLINRRIGYRAEIATVNGGLRRIHGSHIWFRCVRSMPKRRVVPFLPSPLTQKKDFIALKSHATSLKVGG